ncbi:hypothetical protein [Ascidiimonas aurantiaca]|uniref:hypothetical protein n=1 Tax=Ascidiimonas aurantiaca TaxID=1685432 RepID=UPI0030EE622A
MRSYNKKSPTPAKIDLSQAKSTQITQFKGVRKIDAQINQIQTYAQMSSEVAKLSTLQRKANEGTKAGVASKGVVQRMISVKENSKGRITATGDGKRPAGPLSGGSQGDHTTAYVTFEHQLINAVYGVTPAQAWQGLVVTHNTIRSLPGYAQTAKWLTSQSDQRHTNMSAVDPKTVTAQDIQDYANFILEVRNRLKLTALETKGGSTGGHNEATNAGGLQKEEQNIRNGKAPSYTKDDIMLSMMRTLDHERIKKNAVDSTTKGDIVSQHITSILDTYWQVAAAYKITSANLLTYYNSYVWA